MSSVNKRIKIYALEDVQSHKTSCWVYRGNKVYDVSTFLPDHPGGDDLILKYAGQSIDQAMKNPEEHEHSDSAYDMLEEYLIGRLGNQAAIVDENWDAPDDFHPDDTNSAEDFEQNQFLDLRKPLLRQIWESNFSKSYYLQQVHQPRHLSKSARLFGPDVLEILTVCHWWVIPIVWLPITGYLFLRSIFQFGGDLPAFTVNPALPIASLTEVPADAFVKTLLCFFTGNLIWTLLEYTLHRFLFHVDRYLPDRPFFLMLHFLSHGIHHFMPMDRLRLVMPPILFGSLQAPFTTLAHTIFPPGVANGIISGAFMFYVVYDCMHYALHHTRLPAYLKAMKKYHLAHHYKNFELGFGVTSKFWDTIFNTVLPV